MNFFSQSNTRQFAFEAVLHDTERFRLTQRKGLWGNDKSV